MQLDRIHFRDLRMRYPLRFHLALIVLLKLLALLLISRYLFGPQQRVTVDGNIAATQILQDSSAKNPPAPPPEKHDGI